MKKFSKFFTKFFIFISISILSAGFVSATCTLDEITSPTISGYVNGNSYQINFTTTELVAGTCAADAAQFEAWYIYDDNDDGLFNDQIWQSIGTVSPGGELAAYTRSWDTTILSDGDNTRYKVRVTCASNCSGGPSYLAGGDIDTTIGVDNTAPTMSTLETVDMDSNGQIDAVRITFTDTVGNHIKDSTVTASNFDVNGYSNEVLVTHGTVSGDAENDNIIVIGFDESGTSDTDAEPTVQYTAGTLTDNYTDGNVVLSFGPTASVDAAPAVFVAVTNYDVTTDNATTAGQNGENDEFYIRFSEAVDDSTIVGYFMGIDHDNNLGYSYAGILKPVGDVQHGQTDVVDDEYITVKGASELEGTNKISIQINGAEFQDLNGVDNIAQTILYTNTMVSDAAAPQIMGVGYQDTGSTADINEIIVTYSEDITLNEWDTADWLITAGTNDDFVVSDETAAATTGDTVVLTVDWTDFITGESGTEPSLEYVAAAGTANSVHDGNGNDAPDYGATAMSDEAAPKEIQTFSIDADGDGDVDAIEIRFTEYIADSEFDASAIAAWTISSDSWTTSDTIDTFSTEVSVIATDTDADDNYIRLSFTPSNVLGTAVVSRAYNSGGEDIVDGVGNVLTTGYTGTATDRAAPVAISQEYLDTDADGDVDQIRIYYSEEIDYNPIGGAGSNGDYTIVDNDVAINNGGANPSWVAYNGSSKIVYLTISGAAGDTGFRAAEAVHPTIAYTNISTNDITDTALNVSVDFTAKNLEDKAAPAFLGSNASTVSIGDGNGNTDYINMYYSERVILTSPSTDNFTAEDVSSNEISITSLGHGNLITLNLDTTDADQTTAQLQVTATGGIIQDSIGNLNLSGLTDELITDGAEPIAISGNYQDALGDDAIVDRIYIQFSEYIDILASEPGDWSLTGTDAGLITINQVIDMGDNELSLLVTGPADDTNLDLYINYINDGHLTGGTNDTVRDEATSPNFLADFTGLALDDEAAPVLLTSSSTTRTTGDGNGNVEQMLLMYSEEVTFSGTVSDITISTVTGGNEIDVDSISLNPVTIIHAYLSGSDVDQTTAQMDVSYGATIVKDGDGNFALGETNTDITDDAEPIAISGNYQDINEDGIIDRIYLQFSEYIDILADEPDDWTLGGTDAGSVTINQVIDMLDNEISLLVTGPADNTSLDLSIDYTNDGEAAGTNWTVRDEATSPNLLADFTGLSIDDEAAPILIDADYEDSDSDGTVERINLTFSEDLDDDVASLTGSDFTVTINSLTTGEGAVEMVESLDTSTADDDSVFIYFTNGIVDSTNEDYEIAIAANKVGDADGNLMGTVSTTNADDAAAPVAVSITYSNNPADDSGDTIITVVMSEDVSGGVDPSIAINQQGSTDISATTMTDSGDHMTFTYNYDVHQHDGTTYIDGEAFVTISLASDGTNVMTNDTSSSFIIQTVSIETNAIMVDNNDVEIDDNVNITAESIANIGLVTDIRLVITNQSDDSTCTVELGVTETSDSTLGSDSEESVSYSLDLDDSVTACVETGAISDFVVIDTDYKLSIIGQDSIASNWEQIDGDNSAIITVSADTALPADTTAPILTMGTLDSLYEESNVPASWTGSADESGTLSINGVQTAYTGGDTITLTLSNTIGAHTYTVKVTDAAGNYDEEIASYQVEADPVTPDTTAPILTMNGTINSLYEESIVPSNWTGSADESGTLSINGIETTYTGGDTITVTLSNDVGAHTYTVKVTDASGNYDEDIISYQVIEDSITPDTTAPVLTMNGILDSLYEESNVPASWTGTADESGTLSINGEQTAYTGGDTITVTLSNNIGAHTYTIKVTDATGNYDEEIISYQVEADPVTPDTTAPILTMGTLDSLYEESLVPASWTGSADESGTLSINGVQTAYTGGDTITVTLSNDVGAHTYTVKVTDAAGNYDEEIASYQVEEQVNDTAAPEFVSSTPSNAATNVSVTAGEVIIDYDEVVASYDFNKMKLLKVSDDSSVSGTKTSVGNLQFRIGYNTLEYNTSYKILLEEGAVSDSSANESVEKIIYFTTQSATAPTITKLAVNDVTNAKIDIEWTTDVVADTSEYRIGTYAYGSDTQDWTALGSGDHDISGDGVTLDANSTYYYQVRFIKDGETTESVPMEVLTARGVNGLYVDGISTVKSTAKYDATNPWINGWHFRMGVTSDDFDEDQLRMKLDNWVSGSNALATSNNVSIIVSSNGDSHNEATIDAGTMVETTYDAGTTIDISGISDNDGNMPGKQLYIDIYVKIPNGQESGSYSTSYGIANQATDTNWGDLD